MNKRRIAAGLIIILVLTACVSSVAEGNFFTALIVGAAQNDESGYDDATAMLLLSYDWDGTGARLLTLDRDEATDSGTLGQSIRLGGWDGAIDEVNALYGLENRNIIVIDMGNVPALVSVIGGVEITLDESHASLLELEPGLVKMDGPTVEKYLAISITDDPASEANSKRSAILNAVIDKVRAGSVSMSFDLIWNGLGMVKTNIDFFEMASLGTQVLSGGMGGVRRGAVPLAGEKDQNELVREFLFGVKQG